MPVFNPVTLIYEPSAIDHSKCKSVAYNIAQSKSAKPQKTEERKLDYGSAVLQGELYQDNVCITESTCTEFSFLALFQAKGLDDVDGVLGLASHPDKDKQNLSYVWMLRNSGIIDRAIVSFSISGPNMGEQSYAEFGGYYEA